MATLRAALPADRFIEPQGPRPAQDLCRFPTGQALGWVRPQSTEEVSRIVTLAGEAGAQVVAVGSRTAYWWPLRYEGAIALDTGGLTLLEPPSAPEDPVWVGAGVTVRELDEHLRERGMILPCHPDAYGDTTVAAMVATGFTSGCGVGSASLTSIIAGLRVVLGTGEVLTCGASSALGGTPFIRDGLPDPTGLFFASDGALGVVTEVAVRPRPHAPLARLTWSLPADGGGLEQQGAILGAMRSPGLYETCRAVQRFGSGSDEPVTEVDLLVRAPGGASELDERVADLSARVASIAGVRPQCAERELSAGGERVARWWGEPGGAWRELGQLHMVGVDVNLPYSGLGEALRVSDQLMGLARALPWVSLRRALYGAPDHLNLGLHLAFEAPDGAPVEGAHDLVSKGIEAFSELNVVPYRWGRLWGQAMSGRLDPVYLRVLSAMKAACDPDRVLHPGASIWEP